MYMKLMLFTVLWCLIDNVDHCTPIMIMSNERPRLTYVDYKFFKYFLVKTCRISRKDPRYYTDISFESLAPASNKVRVHFYFYQLLTNRYRPSFVELHFGFCDMLEKDVIFGSEMKRSLSNKTCPLPPGQYNFTKMTVRNIPKNFPFRKGRIYINVTYDEKGKTTLLGTGYIDMEIKNVIFKDNQ